MDLDRLNKAIGTFDVAEYLFKIDNGKTLAQCLAIAEAANSYDDKITAGVRKVIGEPEDDEDKPTLAKALANTPNARTKPNIVMGKHPTKVGMHTAGMDKKDTSSRSFNNAANQVSKVQKSMSEAEFIARAKFMSEDNIDNHRNSNGSSDELPWASGQHTPRNVANKVRIVKSAVLKSLETRKACQEEYDGHVNEGAYTLLKKAADRKLQESNNTVAARSIATHARPIEDSVRNRLPADFKANPLSQAEVQKNVADADAVSIRMPNYDTRKSLPAEWQDAKAATLAKQRAGQLRTWNDAQNSLKVQSNKETSELDVEKKYGPNAPGFLKVNGMVQQEVVPPAVLGRQKDGRSIGAETYKKFPAKEPFVGPQEPTGDTGSNIESGRGYY
jgi:hypothetical protein